MPLRAVGVLVAHALVVEEWSAENIDIVGSGDDLGAGSNAIACLRDVIVRSWDGLARGVRKVCALAEGLHRVASAAVVVVVDRTAGLSRTFVK